MKINHWFQSILSIKVSKNLWLILIGLANQEKSIITYRCVYIVIDFHWLLLIINICWATVKTLLGICLNVVANTTMLLCFSRGITTVLSKQRKGKCFPFPRRGENAVTHSKFLVKEASLAISKRSLSAHFSVTF